LRLPALLALLVAAAKLVVKVVCLDPIHELLDRLGVRLRLQRGQDLTVEVAIGWEADALLSQ